MAWKDSNLQRTSSNLLLKFCNLQEIINVVYKNFHVIYNLKTSEKNKILAMKYIFLFLFLFSPLFHKPLRFLWCDINTHVKLSEAIYPRSIWDCFLLVLVLSWFLFGSKTPFNSLFLNSKFVFQHQDCKFRKWLRFILHRRERISGVLFTFSPMYTVKFDTMFLYCNRR